MTKFNFYKCVKSFKNQKGSALIIVLLLLLIFSVITSSVMMTTMNNLYVAQRMSEYEDTYYIAEAGTQHALEFIKQKATLYYMDFYDTGVQDPMFLDSLTDDITTINEDSTDNSECLYIPLVFEEDGVTVTTTIEKMPYEYALTNGNLGADMVYTYRITCHAQSDKSGSERTVIGEISVSNPRVDSKETSSPPLVETRLTVGQEILSDTQNFWFGSSINAILCYSDVIVGQAYSLVFKNNHGTDAFSFFDYEFSNSVPDLLQWDLDYDKFPTHVAFDEYDSLYEKSRGVDYDVYTGDPIFSDRYSIERCEPGYTISEFTKTDAKNTLNGANYRGDGQHLNENNDYDMGIDGVVQKLYIDGEVNISGDRNLKNLYYIANGPITINITGNIDNCIFVSEVAPDSSGSAVNRYVDITCKRIINDENQHKMMKALGNVTINIDDSNNADDGVFIRNGNYNLENLVLYSERGQVRVNDINTNSINKFTRNNEECLGWKTIFWIIHYLDFKSTDVTYNRKIGADDCYFYTNKDEGNASQAFTNVNFHNSYVNAGKDLILRNCSGDNSCFYAHGSNLADKVHDNSWSSFNSTVYNLIYDDYNYGQDNYSFRLDYGSYNYVKTYTGITLESNMRNTGGYTSYSEENVFNDCDFTSGDNIHIGIPNMYEGANLDERVKAQSSRFVAQNEVVLEAAELDTCYVFAGAEGSYPNSDGNTVNKNVIHGIFIKTMENFGWLVSFFQQLLSIDYGVRMDLYDCVLYTPGKILYYNNSVETMNSNTDIDAVKHFDNCLLYCVENFEYNGAVFNTNTINSASDINFQSNYRNYFNDVIIMTESNIRPQSGFGEFNFFDFFDTASDFMIMGGPLTSNELTNSKGVLPQIVSLIGEPATGKGKYRNIEIDAEILYDNYFEQTTDITFKDLPSFDDVFVYEDIYEKQKVDSPYD